MKQAVNWTLASVVVGLNPDMWVDALSDLSYCDLGRCRNTSNTPTLKIVLHLKQTPQMCAAHLVGHWLLVFVWLSQTTGASIQVASEMLPNSTERAVTVSGSGEAIALAIYHVCGIMLEVSHVTRLRYWTTS